MGCDARELAREGVHSLALPYGDERGDTFEADSSTFSICSRENIPVASEGEEEGKSKSHGDAVVCRFGVSVASFVGEGDLKVVLRAAEEGDERDGEGEEGESGEREWEGRE